MNEGSHKAKKKSGFRPLGLIRRGTHPATLPPPTILDPYHHPLDLDLGLDIEVEVEACEQSAFNTTTTG